MKKISILVVAAAALLATACGTNREKALAEIARGEDSLKMDGLMYVSDSMAGNRMIARYEAFANDFPEDTLAPKFLHAAADISLNIGDASRSIALLDRIINDYPQYNDLGSCYFDKGRALEEAERYDDARQTYEEFLALFPDHVMADDTRSMLPFLGMSADSALAQILAKQAATSAE